MLSLSVGGRVQSALTSLIPWESHLAENIVRMEGDLMSSISDRRWIEISSAGEVLPQKPETKWRTRRRPIISVAAEIR